MANDLLDKIGQHHLCLADELKKNRRYDPILQDVPILYRWWFPKSSPVFTYIERQLSDTYLQSLKQKILPNIDSKEETFYALYFGKSTAGKSRFAEHINGPDEDSTLRKTIRAIFSAECTCDTEKLNAELRKCYFEWFELSDDQELIDCIEVLAITVGHYPLNIEANHSDDNNWKQRLVSQRKKSKQTK